MDGFFFLRCRLLSDAQFFRRKLSVLGDVEPPSDEMEVAINAIQIE